MTCFIHSRILLLLFVFENVYTQIEITLFRTEDFLDRRRSRKSSSNRYCVYGIRSTGWSINLWRFQRHRFEDGRVVEYGARICLFFHWVTGITRALSFAGRACSCTSGIILPWRFLRNGGIGGAVDNSYQHRECWRASSFRWFPPNCPWHTPNTPTSTSGRRLTYAGVHSRDYNDPKKSCEQAESKEERESWFAPGVFTLYLHIP